MKFNPICKVERPFWIGVGIVIGAFLMAMYMIFVSPPTAGAATHPAYYEIGAGMLLFLDDARIPPPCTRAFESMRVETVEEFKEAVYLQKPEVIMLDHDLCPQHYQAYRTGAAYEGPTGMDAALFLCDLEDKSFIRSVIVHSMNQQRGDLMYEVLRKAMPDGCVVERLMWPDLQAMESRDFGRFFE